MLTSGFFHTVVILFVSSMTNMSVHVSHTYYKVVWSLLAMGAHYKQRRV